MDVRIHRSDRFGSKQDSVIMCGVDIMKCMQGRFHVTCRRLIVVGSKERVHGDEVRASRTGKPANTSDRALVGILLAFNSLSAMDGRDRSLLN